MIPAKNNSNSDLTTEQLAQIDRRFVAVLTFWFLAVFAAAWFGLYELLPPRPLVIPIAAGIIVPVAIYFLSQSFRRYIRAIPLKHLTLFHIWRIPAGAAFLYYGAQGWLPQTFAHNAGWGDLAVGILTPFVLMLPGGRGKFAAFHIFGILDFIVALGTGILFALTQVPTMDNIAHFPIVLIPMYGVAVTGSLSIMTLHRIAREYLDAAQAAAELAPKIVEQPASDTPSMKAVESLSA